MYNFTLSLIYQTSRKAVKNQKPNKMQNANNTIINWVSDSLTVIRAKQQLDNFLQEQIELKGRCPKIDAYHEKRIFELNDIINNN